MRAMWFLIGVMVGVAVGFCLPRRTRSCGAKSAEPTAQAPSRAWVETRNFLYYDGTVMPKIKEDLNEQ